MNELQKQKLLRAINRVAKNAGSSFSSCAEMRIGLRKVGDAWVCNFDVGGYTTPTIDFGGKTVAVGEVGDDVHVYGEEHKTVKAVGRGWNRRVEKLVKQAIENPAQFVDYELGGRHDNFPR